jgi:hypothetical protein
MGCSGLGALGRGDGPEEERWCARRGRWRVRVRVKSRRRRGRKGEDEGEGTREGMHTMGGISPMA